LLLALRDLAATMVGAIANYNVAASAAQSAVFTRTVITLSFLSWSEVSLTCQAKMA
jgi:hypothetical protein